LGELEKSIIMNQFFLMDHYEPLVHLLASYYSMVTRSNK